MNIFFRGSSSLRKKNSIYLPLVITTQVCLQICKSLMMCLDVIMVSIQEKKFQVSLIYEGIFLQKNNGRRSGRFNLSAFSLRKLQDSLH